MSGKGVSGMACVPMRALAAGSRGSWGRVLGSGRFREPRGLLISLGGDRDGDLGLS